MNLTTARRLLQKNMTDRCRIERDRAGVYDDVLDMNTGKLLARPLVAEVIYDGPCLVTPTGIGQTVEGARVVERKGYRIRVPYDAPRFFKGDVAAVYASEDPQLCNRRLVLTEGSQGATLNHGQSLTAQDVEATTAL